MEKAEYRVVRHGQQFAHDAKDPEFLPIIGKEHPDWIVITKDGRQRWRSDEKDAIMRSGVASFVHVGRGMTHAEIAASLVMQAPRIIRFREKHDPPFIAKVYRPDVKSPFLTRPGRIEMALSYDQWLESRGEA